ncbi:MAG: zinc finger domain-containing protein, partial [Myxococcota bacterium]
ACGIGNVYKSETLFLCQRDPFCRLDTLASSEVQAIYVRARELMQQNMGGGMRDTRRREGGRYWVYGRSGELCRKCGTRVSMRRQGANGRSTYFCPACQRVRAPLTRSRP